MRPLLSTKSLGIIALLVGVVALWPAPAHAFSIVEVFAPKGLLMAIIFILHVVHLILVALVASLGGILNIVLGLDLNYGGPAVYAVWEVFRDICNSLFIVFFILIAFGTIFKTVWKSMSGFYYQSALMNVLVAAILINFSLPIGQTIVWFGNQATSMMAGLMVGQDIGGTIYTALQIQERAEDESPSLPSSSLPDLVTPIEKQPAAQQIATKNYLAKAKTAYENCLKGNQKQNPGECIALAQSLSAASNAKDLDASAGSYTDAALRAVASAWQYAQETANSALATAKNMGLLDSFPGLVKRVISLTINNILLFSLLFSFLLAIVVMVWRIPMIWILLASSSGTFFSYAIPGNEGLKKWFNNMIGYSLFGPLYLFAIYIGMFVLSQQNTLLAGLNNAPWIDGVLGIFLFYFLAFGTFTFGAKLAWDTAFKFSDSLKASVNSVGKFMGVSPDTNFGLNTLSNKIGLTSAYEAAKARGAQAYEDTSASVKSRLGMRSSEEQTARFGRILGVRGAEKTEEELLKKRVEARGGVVKSPLEAEKKKLQNQINGERDVVRRAALKVEMERLEADQEAQLRKLLSSGDRDAALAAGDILMAQGKLTPAEISALEIRYSKISPAALNGFQSRRDTELIKLAGNKKFKGPTAVADMESFMNLIGDEKKAKEFYEAALKGKSKVTAIEAGANLGLITDSKTGRVIRFREALARESGTLTPEQLLDAEARVGGKANMTGSLADLKEAYEKAIATREKAARMLTATTDPAQLIRLKADIRSEEEERGERMAKDVEKEIRREQEKKGEAMARDIEKDLENQQRAEKERQKEQQLARGMNNEFDRVRADIATAEAERVNLESLLSANPTNKVIEKNYESKLEELRDLKNRAREIINRP